MNQPRGLREAIAAICGIVGATAASNLINSVGNRKEEIRKALEESIKEAKAERTHKNIANISSKLDELRSDVREFSNLQSTNNQMVEKLKDIKVKTEDIIESSNSILSEFQKEGVEVSNKLGELVANQMMTTLEKAKAIKDIIDSTNMGGNSLKDNMAQLYEYPNSLHLLQQSAFVHLTIMVLILILIINVSAALFGNAIINYLNLESRYPKLSYFLRLRAKFQNYYIILNIIFLFIVCLATICLNLFLLIQ